MHSQAGGLKALVSFHPTATYFPNPGRDFLSSHYHSSLSSLMIVADTNHKISLNHFITILFWQQDSRLPHCHFESWKQHLGKVHLQSCNFPSKSSESCMYKLLFCKLQTFAPFCYSDGRTDVVFCSSHGSVLFLHHKKLWL